jgi:hypothetical protein
MMGQIPTLLSVRVLVLKIVPKSKACEVHPKNYNSLVVTETHCIVYFEIQEMVEQKKKQGRIADF